MNVIAELKKSSELCLKKGEELQERIEKLNYQKKVADAQNDVEAANKIQIELDINAEMAKSLTVEIRDLTKKITTEQKVYKDRVNERNIKIKSTDNLIKFTIGVAVLSFFGIFVGFSYGLVVFFLALIIAIPMFMYNSKLKFANIDDLHRASGKSESMVTALRERLKAEINLESSVADLENSANKIKNSSTLEERLRAEAESKIALAKVTRAQMNLTDANRSVNSESNK